jgi:DNA (cytosine-5)-methyltransferase 1
LGLEVSVVGLFAGIGGLELGFSKVGFRTSLLAEVDPAASAVLQASFSEAAIVGDVTDISGLPEDTTIVTAGFPCQNLSMAGDKSGIDGTKSGVVSELFRLIERSRPPIVVIENVYFMLQLDGGRAIANLVGRFEELGYLWAYRVLNTAGFGIPQRRRRVYLVASRDLDPSTVLFADETERCDSPTATLDRPLGFYWTEGRSGVGMTVDGIPPLKGGSTIGIPSAPAVRFPDSAVLMPSLSACERLQGFDVGWTSPAHTVGGRKPAWRLLGNAVSVPVAEWVASRLSKPGERLDLPIRPLSPGKRWPDAAFNVGSGRVAVSASDRPIQKIPPSIEVYRDSDWSLLSERALNGFVQRAIEGGLRFPPGFIDSLIKAERRKKIAA